MFLYYISIFSYIFTVRSLHRLWKLVACINIGTITAMSKKRVYRIVIIPKSYFLCHCHLFSRISYNLSFRIIQQHCYKICHKFTVYQKIILPVRLKVNRNARIRKPLRKTLLIVFIYPRFLYTDSFFRGHSAFALT